VKLTIDNLDGAGAVDYSSAISAAAALKITRVLNAPSRCTGMLQVADAGLAVPVRHGRIAITADNGVTLFTGYVATEPEQVYAGVGSAGPVYRVVFNAVSDEMLLDKQSYLLKGMGLSQFSGDVLKTMTQQTGSSLLATTGIVPGNTVGVFEPSAVKAWSGNAGELSGSGYASYRVLNGVITMQTAGTVTHALSDGDGTLQVAALKSAAVKELANDVTLSGAIEPTTYVTETFQGDGVTTLFELSETPYKDSKTQVLSDSFNEAAIDTTLWQVTDPGSHLALSSAGLTMSGGTGLDGQTTLTAISPFEMGGTMVIEAGNVQLGGASDGVLCGLYEGAIAMGNLFVGYGVRQSSGVTVVVPMVNGVEVGTVYTLLAGHAYTLRIRLNCVEMQRVLQTYYAMVDGVVEGFGGSEVAAPMSVVFDLQDLGVSSSTPATVLYDGAIGSTPAMCTFVAVNSIQLFGSMGYCRATRTGSVWVVSTLPSGAKYTRLIGVAGEGVDCKVTSTGRVTFFSGRVPVAGELVTVTYRGRDRSVARMEDAASVAAEAAGGGSGRAQWLGKVLSPVARNSMDCESAAQAVLRFASSRAAAIAGSYEAINLQNSPNDVWPGDVLAITANGVTMSVVVRQVEVEDTGACPETLRYKMLFANDWAEGLGVKLSEAIASDSALPEKALTGPSEVLVNLQQLQVVSATTAALQIDAGMAPPAGGGFEVRRRDWDFGPGVDQDLVLRSPVRSFSIPREGQVERYYVRMYDSSTPPLYSRFSSAVFTDLPV